MSRLDILQRSDSDYYTVELIATSDQIQILAQLNRSDPICTPNPTRQSDLFELFTVCMHAYRMVVV